MDNGKRPLGQVKQETDTNDGRFEFAESTTPVQTQEMKPLKPKRNASFWVMLVLLLLALLAALAMAYLWNEEARKNSDLESKNSSLVQENRNLAANTQTQTPAPTPNNDSRVVTTELASTLTTVSAQHACQADTCAGVEFDVEQVLVAGDAESASFARVEVDRETGDDTDLFIKRDKADAEWKVIGEAKDDDTVPTAVTEAEFPEEFLRD